MKKKAALAHQATKHTKYHKENSSCSFEPLGPSSERKNSLGTPATKHTKFHKEKPLRVKEKKRASRTKPPSAQRFTKRTPNFVHLRALRDFERKKKGSVFAPSHEAHKVSALAHQATKHTKFHKEKPLRAPSSP
ncbi:hypothetical protein EFY79_12875 [Hanamia caeni]|uniref:Uncharacterized protein n=1 Tax=Hanamia caeni TaxID=2294116 RepID=A0A3M9NDX0_9BACT|nr:hypothetical protein EFY79_12875 [Hanamia caeni]